MALTKELTPLLKRAIRKYNVPGASIAILKNDRLMTTAVAGVTNLDTRVPVTPDTVFQIGSITKPITTTLVMQLVDEGKVDLDTPIVNYLPEFRVADLAVSRRVTARHFLSHQSGIDGDLFVDSGRGDECVERLMDKATMVPSLFPIGEKISYCNLGFAVLGRLIEVMTGQSWDEALRTRLFEPLGMKHAFSQPEMALRFRCAVGHVPSQRKRGTWYVARVPYLAFGQKAAGSTPTMSAENLLRFAAMHMRGGRNESGDKVLTAKSVRAMQTRQIKTPKHTPYAVTHWGLGWMLADWAGHKLYGHDGATIGQNAFLRILPEKDIAVAMLTNGGDTAGLNREMYSHIFGELARIQPPQVPDYDPGARFDVDSMVGTYANLNQSLVFTKRAGKLTVSVKQNGGGQAPFPDNAKLGAVDPQTARLQTGDAIQDRSLFLFSDFETGKASYVALGLRQYRRVAD